MNAKAVAAQKKRFVDALWQTWSSIAADWLASYGGGEPLDDGDAQEASIEFVYCHGGLSDSDLYDFHCLSLAAKCRLAKQAGITL